MAVDITENAFRSKICIVNHIKVTLHLRDKDQCLLARIMLKMISNGLRKSSVKQENGTNVVDTLTVIPG